MDLSLRDFLLIGSYLFGASSWIFLYRELRSVRQELAKLRMELAYSQGKAAGEDHESRLGRLEHPM